jgi:hypothetical protein
MNQQIEQQSEASLYKVPSLTWTAPTLWTILWRWGLATAGGAILAFIPAFIGFFLAFSIRTDSATIIIALITAAAMAAPIALFQREVLGTLSELEGWWVRATVAGAVAGVGLIILDMVFDVIDPLLRLLLGNIYYYNSLIGFFGQIGLVIGIGQWLVLRRSVPRAGWWIAANLLAGMVVGWIGELRGEEFVLGIFQLLAHTIITGITLRLLLGQRRFDSDRP